MRAEMHNFFRYEEEKKEMENEIAHLKSQFVALEQYAEQCIKDVERLTMVNKRLKDQIAQMERDHKQALEEATSMQNNERSRLLDRIDKLEKALNGVRQSTDKELEIK